MSKSQRRSSSEPVPEQGATAGAHMGKTAYPPFAQRPPRARGRAGPASRPHVEPAETEALLCGLAADLMQNSQSLRAMVVKLVLLTEGLCREVEAEMGSVRRLMSELSEAERRAGNAPFAALIDDCLRRERSRQTRSRSGIGARDRKRAPPAGHGRLGAREREVLQLITEGLHSPRIADQLGIKTATVEVHRRNIMRKLNLHSVAALTKYAVREGLTEL